MKIGIIGFGYVGSAIAWTHRHDDLVVVDPKLPDSAKLSDLTDCDGIFVCVPSPPIDPTLADGRCDTSILENVLKDLLFVNIANGIPIICKTTAPPSVYERLHRQYPNIVYCPEFLTAKNHIADYANADYYIIGGEPKWQELAHAVITKDLDKKVVYTDIKNAAFYKYMMNSYLATKVSFMNDFKQLADAEGISWNELKVLAHQDKRIGTTHMDVPGPDGEYGWGGACFPKDIAAIIEEALSHNLDFELLQRVEALNKKHRRQNGK
jgi:UDPglucose 6-dehydrogenase